MSSSGTEGSYRPAIVYEPFARVPRIAYTERVSR